MIASHSNILVCPDEKAASREAAERFVCAAVRSVAMRGTFFVALSGGGSPKGMYELLGSAEFSGLIPWTRTELFFSDERCVPPESDQSNYRMVNEALLSVVPIPEGNIHRFRGEDPPEAAAEQYEQEIHDVVGESPRFDLILLGLGADTHTASLFPNTPALREAGRHAAANYVEKLGQYRLTMTLPLINQAESVIILTFGEDKAAAVAEALCGPVDVERHPVQAVHPAYGRALWIVDQAAASKITSQCRPADDA